MSEDALHKAVAHYLTLVLSPPTWWTTFPSGGGGKARGGQLKARGLKAGVPDLVIIHEGRAYFIELKTAKGRLSFAQQDTADLLAKAGAYFVVARGIDDVEAWLSHWRIPTRIAKVAA